MIPLDDVVLRDDLDPRLGERDDDLIQQYADIFDALPPIEINQHYELIDGWHRVRAAEHAKRTEIAYVVIETEDDDDLADKMWAANLKHGVQYTRAQRQTHGLKLNGRGLKAKEIAERIGVGASSVYRWTKEHREKEKQERDAEIHRLREEGYSQQEIGDELKVAQRTISDVLSENSQMGKTAKADAPELRTVEQPVEGPVEEKSPATSELESEKSQEPDSEADTGEAPAEEEVDISELDLQLETDDTPAAEEEAATPEPEREAHPPEPIPEDILKTARIVMGAFAETRPDDYMARLEASPSEWMTITDDSLSNELERELLSSAAAMCLWQECMIWYQGGRTSAFTDVFGRIGPVFVRGQAGQWRIVSKLRSMLKRLWA